MNRLVGDRSNPFHKRSHSLGSNQRLHAQFKVKKSNPEQNIGLPSIDRRLPSDDRRKIRKHENKLSFLGSLQKGLEAAQNKGQPQPTANRSVQNSFLKGSCFSSIWDKAQKTVRRTKGIEYDETGLNQKTVAHEKKLERRESTSIVEITRAAPANSSLNLLKLKLQKNSELGPSTTVSYLHPHLPARVTNYSLANPTSLSTSLLKRRKEATSIVEEEEVKGAIMLCQDIRKNFEKLYDYFERDIDRLQILISKAFDDQLNFKIANILLKKLLQRGCGEGLVFPKTVHLSNLLKYVNHNHDKLPSE